MYYDELVERLRKTEFTLDVLAIILPKAADAIEELSMKFLGDEAAIAGMKREIERMIVAGKPRWIPVEESLPDDNTPVLVVNDDGKVIVAKHEKDIFGWYLKYSEYDFDVWDACENGAITHWMPLPEPPKEDPNG